MTDDHATMQREAVAHALSLSDGERVHVYGPKLYGLAGPDEYHCSRSAPFNGVQPGTVVFHADAQPLGWSGDCWCAACGVHSTADGAS